MRQNPIMNTSELSRDMIVLTGSTFYSVLTWRRNHFTGHVWNYDTSSWGPIRTVPLPSPTQSAYEVTERHLFPSAPKH